MYQNVLKSPKITVNFQVILKIKSAIPPQQLKVEMVKEVVSFGKSSRLTYFSEKKGVPPLKSGFLVPNGRYLKFL